MFRFIFRQWQLESQRLVLTGAAFASVIAIILLLEGFYQGVVEQSRNAVFDRNADLVVMQAGTTNMIAARSILPQFARQEVEDIEGVEIAHPLTGISIIYERQGQRTPLFLMVYESGGGPVRITSGSQITNSRGIVIDRSIADRHKLDVGDVFLVSDFEFRIDGIAEGASALLTGFGFARYDDLLDFYFESDLATDISTFPLLSFLIVELQDEADPEIVSARIEEAVSSADVFQPDELADQEEQLVRALFGPILGFLIGLGYLIGVVATGMIMFSSLNNRRRDFGVLKALGFSNGFLNRTAITEALILVTLATPLGIVMAQVLAIFIQHSQPIYVILPLEIEIILRTWSGCLLFAVVGALMPVRLIHQIEPDLALRG